METPEPHVDNSVVDMPPEMGVAYAVDVPNGFVVYLNYQVANSMRAGSEFTVLSGGEYNFPHTAQGKAGAVLTAHVWNQFHEGLEFIKSQDVRAAEPHPENQKEMVAWLDVEIEKLVKGYMERAISVKES